MSEQRQDNRQAPHIQVYRSEVKTLARTWGGVGSYPKNMVTSAEAHIRVIKSDYRLPTTVYVGFDPDGGNPDKASITASMLTPVSSEQQPSLKASVSELMLMRRSYIPILKAVGNGLDIGRIDVPARPGALGFAWRLSDECDAIDLRVQLPHAVGELIEWPGEGAPVYWYGRWICGYSFTCNERLSREEWNEAVTGTNMLTEVYGEPNVVDGIPNIIKMTIG